MVVASNLAKVATIHSHPRTSAPYSVHLTMVPVTFSTFKTSELWEPSMFLVADNSNGRKLTDDMIKAIMMS
jgi:hypothetical protein